MVDPIQDIEDRINLFLKNDDIDSACNLLTSFVLTVICDQRSVGRVFGSHDLDRMCRMIWEKFDSLQPSFAVSTRKNTSLSVYVATELYIAGGHTAVIEDLIKFQPERQHIILLTDLYNRGERREVIDRFSTYGIDVRHAPNGAYTVKATFIKSQIIDLSPSEVFIFGHNQDPIPLLVAYMDRGFDVYYYHHGDHTCTLGLYLPNVTHIDPHPFGYFNCKESLGVQRVCYLPLSVTDVPTFTDRKFLQSGSIITCSSGRLEKFIGTYSFSYFDEIPQILRLTRGKHIHIGPVTEDLLKLVRKRLAERGIDEKNFVYIPWVRSVAQAMIEFQVDVYISSFPLGGGKTSVEVMSSGTPILNHQHYKTSLFSGAGIIYPEAMVWRNLSDLYECLESISEPLLIQQSQLAREHYLRYNTPNVFKDSLHQIREGELLPPPDKLCPQDYCYDALRAYLDEVKISESYIAQKVQSLQEELTVTKSRLEYTKSTIEVLAKRIAELQLDTDNAEIDLSYFE